MSSLNTRRTPTRPPIRVRNPPVTGVKPGPGLRPGGRPHSVTVPLTSPPQGQGGEVRNPSTPLRQPKSQDQNQKVEIKIKIKTSGGAHASETRGEVDHA